jgi:hypothetical protein
MKQAHKPIERRVIPNYLCDYASGNRCETPHADYRSQIATTTFDALPPYQAKESETSTAATLLDVTESKYFAG